ncbi:hypothetical protein [Streptomyces sp. NPDC017529]|uniref:hypothetical protein n=1 Tax=Streptomyces sp. NPDC017529 TaxID=3365000 RepID=UPI0037AD0E72
MSIRRITGATVVPVVAFATLLAGNSAIAAEPQTPGASSASSASIPAAGHWVYVRDYYYKSDCENQGKKAPYGYKCDPVNGGSGVFGYYMLFVWDPR